VSTVEPEGTGADGDGHSSEALGAVAARTGVLRRWPVASRWLSRLWEMCLSALQTPKARWLRKKLFQPTEAAAHAEVPEV
jgi:hypothetical protein